MSRKKTETTWGDMDVHIVHIIPQVYWHTPAFIVGNESGLRALHAALSKALKSPSETQKAAVMADDGEGYGIFVRCVSTDEMSQQPLGYTDETAGGRSAWVDWMRRAR